MARLTDDSLMTLMRSIAAAHRLPHEKRPADAVSVAKCLVQNGDLERHRLLVNETHHCGKK